MDHSLKMINMTAKLFIFFYLFNAFLCLGQTRTFEGYTQSEMNINAKKEYIEITFKQDSLYKTILKKHTTDKIFLSNLKKSKKKWEEWRDSEINTFFPNYPNIDRGTMFPICYYSKLIDWTEERIQFLYNYLIETANEELCGPGQ